MAPGIASDGSHWNKLLFAASGTQPTRKNNKGHDPRSAISFVRVNSFRAPTLPRSYAACLRRLVLRSCLPFYLDPGGKCLNSSRASLSSFLMSLSGLDESISVAVPRQIRFLELASNMSTTRVPTS